MNFPFVRIAVLDRWGRSAQVNNEGRRHGTIEPDSSGEMADGDPVTATSPVENGSLPVPLAVYVL
jgi:hypothetical protein